MKKKKRAINLSAKKILLFCKLLDDAAWNKSDRERQMLHDFPYLWNLKNRQNKQNKTEADP